MSVHSEILSHLEQEVGLPGFEPGSMAPKATSIPS